MCMRWARIGFVAVFTTAGCAHLASAPDWTASPTALYHRATVASLTDSPSAGTLISTVMSDPLRLLSLREQSSIVLLDVFARGP